MSTSLNKLINNLKPNPFNHVRQIFGDDCELLLRKSIFPYDWFDSFEKLIETQLLPKETFYSKLNNSKISDEDDELAQKVWEIFGCKTCWDYHDLYMKLDALLLTDAFENFRSVCMKHYEKRDPCWYYTALGLAWDACLKESKI